ncbi:hypothetical protein [Rubrivirga marina]|uniref:MucB/RseB N-terminal domain-containing protein n=1 Tax=Rubrivirga marina TaxID=1196024 RepID=A0A271J1R1_9BACT|nr:hypothetical protein [Rubrivirga marina]PAP76895.1 hypothetical protein BSZ37_10855 [Rubrivirga marina]
MRLAVLAFALSASAAAQPDPLAALADALGGRARIDAVETLEVRSRTRATVGEATVTVRSTLAVEFPDAARWTAKTDGPERATWLDGEAGRVAAGDSVRALPEAAVDALQAALWLRPLVLAARRAELSAEALGADLLRVDVPGRRDPLIIGLDDAGRPARITTFRRQGGRREYVEVVLRDYREVDGVFVPHRVRQAVGGVVTGVTTVESVRLGAALEGAPFGAGGG